MNYYSCLLQLQNGECSLTMCNLLAEICRLCTTRVQHMCAIAFDDYTFVERNGGIVFIYIFIVSFILVQTKSSSERVYNGSQLDKLSYNQNEAQQWQFIDEYLAVVAQLARFILMPGNNILILMFLLIYHDFVGMTEARTRTLIYSSIESMLQLCCKNICVNENCTIADNPNTDICIVGMFVSISFILIVCLFIRTKCTLPYVECIL
jgi:hypothetical protein